MATSTAPDRAFGIRRHREGRVVAGVAVGIAHRIGVPVVYVRAGFLVLGLVWGIGLLLYAALWAATADQVVESVAGDRPVKASIERRLGLAALFVGGLLILRAMGIWTGDSLVWPATAVIFGLAVLFEQREIDSRIAILRLFDPHDGSVRMRAVIGVVLLILGLGVFGRGAVPELGTAMLAMVVTGLGLSLVFGPWVWRLVEELGNERRERIRQEERAEMASHLHDSVLQTLTLIQRTDDPRRMVTLARAQERELRRWLFETAPMPDGDLLSVALQSVADRIEVDFDVRVEVVTVGDSGIDQSITALVAAVGEATLNAAKHSGVDRVSIYAETTPEAIEVWISDQGAGFDRSLVGDDRRGISQSILARMERHGGSASVTSEPGEGTEVHLRLPREVK